MEERRKLQRKTFRHYLRVYDKKTGQPIGDAANVSTEGIMLICSQPVETNTLFRLRMVLPKESHKNSYLEFFAECKYWEKGFIPDSYRVGFQLKYVSEDCIQYIERLIENFC